MDNQIVHATTIMLQQILLTVLYRFETYESRGILFESIENRLVKSTLADRIYGLMIELIQILSVHLKIDASELMENLPNDTTAIENLNKFLNLHNEAA